MTVFITAPGAVPPPEAAPSSAMITSVWDLAVKGGPLMIPIGLASVVAVTIAADRLFALRRNLVAPKSLEDELVQSLSAGAPGVAGAIAQCEKRGTPLGRLAAVGLRGTGSHSERAHRVHEASTGELARLRRHLRTLAVIASIAPMLGLLGTIFGMIDAFHTVATSADALGKTELLADGIYQAMITTAAGLCVAIPVVLAHQGLMARSQALALTLDASLQRVLGALPATTDSARGQPHPTAEAAEEPPLVETTLARTPALVPTAGGAE